MKGTTLQRVAEHIGASKASVLHYFSTKQNLIETALRRANTALRVESAALQELAKEPWEKFYAIIEANFSPTTFRSQVAHGWIAMCAEVPHNSQFQRLQTIIYRRLHSNLSAALKQAGVENDEAQQYAHTISLMIDGLWMRCGLQIGGLNSDEAKMQIETVVSQFFGNSPERTAARDKMESLAAAVSAI